MLLAIRSSHATRSQDVNLGFLVEFKTGLQSKKQCALSSRRQHDML